MVAASCLWVVLVLLILVFRGGGAARVEPPVEPRRPSLAQQAQASAARGDYEGAWRLYHQALQAAPEDVSLWYALGVTLSRLDKGKETEEAFQQVVRRGNPDSEEVRLARRWLVSAGALAAPVTFSPPEEPAEATAGTATVEGKATWGEPDPDKPPLRAQVLLEGLEGEATGKLLAARVLLGQAYRFDRLPAGSYRVIGGAAGRRLWDLTVTLEEGESVVLDLGKDNSLTPDVELYV